MSVAVVVEAPGAYRIVPHEPTPPGAGEALVRVHAVGICGSDREVYQGNRPEGYVRYPLTPGHEWSGTVEAVGPDAPQSLVGRKVVGEGFRNCQVCDRCHAGETTLCTAGYEETGFTQPGAMAATLTLPARLLHVLPDDADLTAAALLEPAACVAAAALKADARPGERVAVVGAGTLGMLALQFLAANSPPNSSPSTPGPNGPPCRTARRDGLPYARPGAARRLRRGDRDRRLRGLGPCRGVAAAARGRLVLTGLPASGAAGLDPTGLVVRQLEVRTVFGAPPAAWAHAVRVFGAGLLDPLPLVTHELPLDQFPYGIELVGSGDPEVGKVLLLPKGPS